MLTATLGPLHQLAVSRLPARPASRSSFLPTAGGLREHELGYRRLPIYQEALAFIPSHTLGLPQVLDAPLVTDVELLDQPAAEPASRILVRAPSTFAVESSQPAQRFKPPQPVRDALPFVVALRSLLERDRLGAAREMLNATPSDILSDPLVARLRSILAPPGVKRVGKRDLDRSSEYQWLRAQGHQYRGRWVALDGDSLIASAGSLRELQAQLRARALARPPLLHRVD